MVTISDALKVDAAALGVLSESAFGHGFDGSKVRMAVHDFAEEEETESHSVFSQYRVAKFGDAPVGMCGIYRLRWVGPQVRYLGWFFVDPVQRRQGIGGMLLTDSIETSRGLGARWLMVETDGQAKDAQRLYEAHGFSALANIPDYWPDRDSLVLMGLRLQP